MEQSNPAEIRVLLKEVFNKFDKDKNGYIDIEETNLIFKELGQEVSNDEIKEFFNSIDQNHDGKLSFEELFTWFTSGRGQEVALGEALKFKMIYMMEKTRKALLKYSSAGGEMEIRHIEINAGKKVLNPKSLIEVSALVGIEAEEKFKSLVNGLEVSQDLGVVIEIKSSLPQQALTEILELLEQAKEFAKDLVPPEIGIDSFKFSGTVDGDTVKVRIDYDGPMTEVIKSEVQGVLSTAFPGETSVSIIYGIYFANGLTKTNLSLISLLNDGISIFCDAKLPSSFMQALRDQLLNPEAIEKLPREMRPFALLLAMTKVNVEIDIMPLGSLIEKLFPEIHQFTVNGLAEQGEKLGINQIISQLPIIPDLVSLGFSKLIADFKLHIKMPKAMTSLHLKLDGIGEVLSFLKQ